MGSLIMLTGLAIMSFMDIKRRAVPVYMIIVMSILAIGIKIAEYIFGYKKVDVYEMFIATVYKGNIIKNLIMDCQSYTKYRPNETTGGIFVSWRRKEELPTGA